MVYALCQQRMPKDIRTNNFKWSEMKSMHNINLRIVVAKKQTNCGIAWRRDLSSRNRASSASVFMTLNSQRSHRTLETSYRCECRSSPLPVHITTFDICGLQTFSLFGCFSASSPSWQYMESSMNALYCWLAGTLLCGATLLFPIHRARSVYGHRIFFQLPYRTDS